MVDPILFIPFICIFITSALKDAFPNINGWLTRIVVLLVGVLVSLLASWIGVAEISIAAAIMAAAAGAGGVDAVRAGKNLVTR